MPPNFNDISAQPGPVNFVDPSKENGLVVETSTSNTSLKVVRSMTTLVCHILIGFIVGASILFAFRNGTTSIGATNVHIILCVIGFNFLMVEATLSLAPDSWLSSLNLRHRRWVHTLLQVVGSALAIAGCIHKALDKNINWNTFHGQFGLVAMIFTTVCLVNGVATLYAYECRKVIPPISSKLIHILFGVVAIVAASISLAYGFDKGFFRDWATSRLTDTLIIMTGAFTTICIINPFITFFTKLAAFFNN